MKHNNKMISAVHLRSDYMRRVTLALITLQSILIVGRMSTEETKKRTLLAVIGDEDTVTGMLLAGIGEIDNDAADEYKQKNFLVVDSKTTPEQLAESFDHFTQDRDDIAILLINQHLAEQIRYKVEDFTAAFPAVLEIPSKDHAYDPEKDSVLRRVKRLFGE